MSSWVNVDNSTYFLINAQFFIKVIENSFLIFESILTISLSIQRYLQLDNEAVKTLKKVFCALLRLFF